MGKMEELLAVKLAKIDEEDKVFRMAYKEDLVEEIHEFYNMDHGQDGRFSEGSDGPGRKKDNLKKTQAILGKKAPKALQDLLSRRLGRARTKAEKILPKTAAAYQKALAKRVAEKRVIKGQE